MINTVVRVILFLIVYVGAAGAMEVSTSVRRVPDSYSINLMCINPKKAEEHKYIFFIDDEDKLISNILDTVIKWAEANLTAEVTLWIDGDYVTEDQVQNTQMVLSKLLNEKTLNNGKMRKVKEIPIIRDNPDAFSDQIYVYDRGDLFKLIIIVHSIENEKKDAAIFADLKVGDLRVKKDRMGKDELFDADAMERSADYGGLLHNARGIFEYVKDGINYSAMHGNENQFLQLINNPVMISAIKTHIINLNLMRIRDALNNLNNEHWPKYLSITALGGPIFESTISGVYYFYSLIAPKEQSVKLRDYLELSDNFNCWGPRRIVDVRDGTCHFPNRSDLTPRLPAKGGDTYCVKQWD